VEFAGLETVDYSSRRPLIGLEVVCRSDWLQPSIEGRLVHLIAHEYAHVQQFPQGGEDAASE
jgi:hypothetical protein